MTPQTPQADTAPDAARPAVTPWRCHHCGQDTHGGWLLKAGAPIPCCEDCRALALHCLNPTKGDTNAHPR